MIFFKNSYYYYESNTTCEPLSLLPDKKKFQHSEILFLRNRRIKKVWSINPLDLHATPY